MYIDYKKHTHIFLSLIFTWWFLKSFLGSPVVTCRHGPTCLIQGQQLSVLFPRRIPEDSPGESLCIVDGEYIPYTMCD